MKKSIKIHGLYNYGIVPAFLSDNQSKLNQIEISKRYILNNITENNSLDIDRIKEYNQLLKDISIKN